MYALVDCNSFYASCEQALNPAYRSKPLVVLSNNDGIVIARSQEAKDLGVQDLIVYHKTKDLIERNKIIVVSSNYTLYHDMSMRVKEILKTFIPYGQDEDYSIDESFLDLKGMNYFNLTNFGKKIQDSVFKQTRVPVSVGIAPTKVLCKAANHVAKKFKLGTLVIQSDSEIKETLQNVSIEKVWGVGRQYSIKLRLLGINTAWDLRGLNTTSARKLMTIAGERIVMELQGISCIDLDFDPPPKSQILSTRSFGKTVTKFSDLKESVAMHCHIAAKKLRKHGLAAKNIGVFVHTHWFDEVHERYYNSASMDMHTYTAATNDLIVYASLVLEKIYKPGILYKKSGIMLNDIQVADRIQFHLFGGKEINEESESLMKSLDQINHKYGTYCVRFAALPKLRSSWDMRINMKSPDSTTEWNQIPKAYIDY